MPQYSELSRTPSLRVCAQVQLLLTLTLGVVAVFKSDPRPLAPELGPREAGGLPRPPPLPAHLANATFGFSGCANLMSPECWCC